MRFALAALAAAAIVGCSAPKSAAPVAGLTELMDGYALGEPILYENAAFVPVLSTTPPADEPVDDTITLAEAKKNGWVEIIELPGDEQVSLLKVRNNGPKPLLLLSGELLLGGKQDRVVAKDTIVPAGETKDVEVFCVEHGRWDGMSRSFEYGGTMVPDKVRKSAQYGGQAEVWGEVAEKNETLAQPRNGRNASSIRTFLNDEGVQKKLKDAVGTVGSKLDQPKVVGVLFILNGEIQTLELFDTPSLFKRAHRPILESFLAEAATSPKSDAKALDKEAYGAFVTQCLTAPAPTEAGYNAIDSGVVRGRGYNRTAGAKSTHSSFEPKK